MKGKRFFGYKLLCFIALAAVILNAAAHPRHPFPFFVPAPEDTTKKPSDTEDTAHKLKFPIHDKTGDPRTDLDRPKSIDLQDPKSEKKMFEYDPDSNRYYYNDKMGSMYNRNPTYMSLAEYTKYRAKMDDDAYWQRRLDAMMLFNKKPELPQMYKDGLFDRIFGSNTISVKPQGNVDVTFGGNWQNIKNPTLVQRAQKYGIFDFDMQMNLNLLATVGDKLKLNISNNTKATFDYQNMQKLDYSGKEDEMIKKIEAGNVSFPLKSNLISGVQSLFGLKTQLQFGRLWVTGVVSQQKSQRKSLTVQGGSQAQQFSIKADAYEENKDFLLSQYFHDRYNLALKDFPVINSQVQITKIQVWVTNRTGVVNGVRDVVCFQDLGEANPYMASMNNGAPGVRDGVPDNGSNRLYTQLLQSPNGRQQRYASNSAVDLGLELGKDFERTTARQLAATEYNFNPQLGYIMLHTQMNPDDVLGVAYRYTYKGKVYQVGDFAEDLPPDTTNPKVLYLKLMKGTSNRPYLPVWKLMMKNVYALGGFGLTKENFTLNVMYQDPGGGDKRYFPEGPKKGTTFISLLNLDRLNSQNEAQPDGVFDFVDGITINMQQGKIIFPVLEPFGNDLSNAVDATATPIIKRRYIFQALYDSTKTIAQQFQSLNRYVLKGTYKSSSSSEIFLGGFNIPAGSVSVTAGGTKLVENQDYQIEYGLGRLKILNTGILSSGVPINISYEDNSTFGFQQQNFMGARFDYYMNKKLTLGGTIMRLNERPFTQKVSFGEDPIKNTVIGLDANYQSESPLITRIVDKLPIYSTTAPSFVNISGEVAGILPGHPKQINSLDPEGAVYIDDFEGTTSSYDMRFPAQAWSIASTPFGATDKAGKILFPEASLSDQLKYGENRARLAWYSIEPTLVDPGQGVPDYVKNDSNQHFIRLVQVKDVFPNRPTQSLQTSLSTFDLSFFPKDRGPYNFDAVRIDDSGHLTNPKNRWGGIMRPIDNTDFEASNVQYVQFWMLSPFTQGARTGGSLFLNLGSVSEDVLKDSRMSFENGVPYPFDQQKVDTTIWGYVPRFQQQITRAFDNDPSARAAQDVGYDEMDNGREATQFKNFLNTLRARLGASNPAYLKVSLDPASDDYKYYRGSDYDNAKTGILGRYKGFNNPEGNSPVTDPNSAYATSATTIPESEDINRDNTLNEAENYYQYRLDLDPNNMRVGNNYIISEQVSKVKLPNGQEASETWYQFKVPIRNYDRVVGGISDFRSIRFLRMFLSGWEDSTVMRFASLELGRSQWRTYNYSLTTPGENQPQQNASSTDFSVTSVSIEENASRYPIPYVIPPGVQRQLTTGQQGTTLALNEQSISLKACALQDGDARGVFKEVNVDMRQFTYLRMFIHAESQVGQAPIKDADISSFIRIGADFTGNYYEYRMPLAVTQPGSAMSDVIWPAANEMNLTLQDLVEAKKERDAKNLPTYIPYYTTDSKGNTIVVLGNPNIGGAKNMMLGIVNPKKSNQTPGDDGIAKCVEVWFDEMRMAGTKDQPGYAAAGKVSVQMADLGSVNLSGSMHTQGYGNIDQKIGQRSQDDYYQYNVSTNLNLGKLAPRKLGLQLPFYAGYTQNVTTPKYNPYNQDVLLSDAMNSAGNAAKSDSIKKASQDFTSITSLNFTNVRINGSPGGKGIRMPWSIKNFDFTYSYNNQFKHNALIALDNINTQKLGVGYTYSIKTKSFEPFKKMIKSKSKWYGLIRDFNINPLPSNFSVRNELNRLVEETRVRDLNDGSGFQSPATFYKNFNWTRVYNTRWEITKSLSVDYTATNVSRIDEPYGRIDSKEKRDSVIRLVSRFGHNTSYTQTFNSSYTAPLSKLPATDWMNVRMSYSANYTWTGAAPVAYELGNTIGNTNTKTISGDLDFNKLYSKWRWMRALNVPNKKGVNGKGPKEPPKSEIPTPSGKPDGGAPKISDLRKDGKQLPGSIIQGDVDDMGGAAGGGAGNGTSAPGGNTTGTNGQTNGSGSANGGGTPGNTGTTGAGGTSGGTNPTNPTGTNPNGGNTGGGNGTSTNGSGGTSGTSNNGGGSTGGSNTGGGNTGNPNGGGPKGGVKGSGASVTPPNGGNNGGNNGNGGGGGNTGGNGNPPTVKTPPAGPPNIYQNVNTTGMTDQQLDSLVSLQDSVDRAFYKAEKLKKKKARKAARKARRAKLPELSVPVKIGGHILTMLTRVSVNYTENAGTVLPGYLDSTRFMGVNNYSAAPGWNYVYGYQPTSTWLEQKASEGKLTRDSLFNAQLQQTYSQNLSATATLVPFKDFRVDLSLTKTFSKSHSELFKDTGTGTFVHFNPYENGSFNISYIAVKTIFKNTGVYSDVYNQFLSGRETISQRLGASNPYTNGIPDPSNPKYNKGYTEFSQDVLVPSFIAAYTGNSASTQPLLDYKHTNIKDNPFKYLIPMPNWKVTYNGLSKYPFFAKYLNNLNITHAYTGSMSMNGYNSSLLFTDLYGLGFPSFIDSNSHNYVPFFQVPNVTIQQSFNPLIGIDLALKNNLTAKFELRKSKTMSLSLIDYQVSENASTEYVIGFGFRKKGIKLPFQVFGITKLKNELIFKMDIGLRDDKNSNTFLANNISVTSRGQQVLRVSPSVDYAVNNKLTLHFYFDRQQTIPYVSTSYPTTNTKAGLTLRFIFGN
ncbi:cell surface protein SprA [Flavipsychrobacter stenotrophus]|uniref:Cell surface protein SprA n=1 Tax=Flavipsychrobacter stenotrophus TaxID=2077091 RepID=A0A2S7SVQ9_9BACT|nr:cell surface protein SprA [Flavipsychrobacter stenotrophus]PQJ10993.1 cell surface protein SprA [Flavipsychrobacter stenotrophus]